MPHTTGRQTLHLWSLCEDVVVESGQDEAIVLSGLISKSNGIVSRKVPYLSDVPLLGRLHQVVREVVEDPARIVGAAARGG